MITYSGLVGREWIQAGQKKNLYSWTSLVDGMYGEGEPQRSLQFYTMLLLLVLTFAPLLQLSNDALQVHLGQG